MTTTNRRQRRALLGPDAKLPATALASTGILSAIKDRSLLANRWKLILEGGEPIPGRNGEKALGLIAEFLEVQTDFNVFQRQCAKRAESIARMAPDAEGLGMEGARAQAELALSHMMRVLDDKQARKEALEEEIESIQEAIKETSGV